MRQARSTPSACHLLGCAVRRGRAAALPLHQLRNRRETERQSDSEQSDSEMQGDIEKAGACIFLYRVDRLALGRGLLPGVPAVHEREVPGRIDEAVILLTFPSPSLLKHLLKVEAEGAAERQSRQGRKTAPAAAADRLDIPAGPAVVDALLQEVTHLEPPSARLSFCCNPLLSPCSRCFNRDGQRGCRHKGSLGNGGGTHRRVLRHELGHEPLGLQLRHAHLQRAEHVSAYRCSSDSP